MPPLRERNDDVPLLVQHFIEEFNPRISNEIKGISKDAKQCLRKYNWPGNVQELKNVIEQAMSMAEQDTITIKDLLDNLKRYDMSLVDDISQDTNFQEAKEKCLNEFHKKHIGFLLKKYDGNITKVAQECGLSRWTIYGIIKGLNF